MNRTVAPTRRIAAGLTALAATTGMVLSFTGAPQASAAQPARIGPAGRWIASWESPTVARTDVDACTDCTVRNTAHLSVGGPAVRVRLSNPRSSGAVTINTTTVSLPSDRDGAAARPGSLRHVTFNHHGWVKIPPKSWVTSDPVALPVASASDLQVSVFARGTAQLSPHDYHARTATWIATGADQAASTSASAFTSSTNRTYVASEVDVLSHSPQAGTIVTLGDSITDGFNSTAGTDSSWPDDLATRLLARPGLRSTGVANAGISANWLSEDKGNFGLSAAHRFTPDALSVSGVRTITVMEGINDIQQVPGQPASASQLTGTLSQLIARAHARGIRIVGVTMTPFGGATNYTAQLEQTRTTVNDWIRAGHGFDAVLDFDQVLRDPSRPTQMLAQYDSGDHLHPSSAGYQYLAGSINLSKLVGPCRLAAPQQRTVQPATPVRP